MVCAACQGAQQEEAMVEVLRSGTIVLMGLTVMVAGVIVLVYG